MSPAEDFIKINEELFLQILSYLQVSPCYLNLISSLRTQSLTEAADLFFGRFRSLKSFNSTTIPIEALDRSGYQFYLAFKLKTVSKLTRGKSIPDIDEPAHIQPAKYQLARVESINGELGAANPATEEIEELEWSINEAAVYQQFDMKQSRVVWIITALPRESRVPGSPSNPSDPWSNIIDVTKVWAEKAKAHQPQDCFRASLSVLEWLGERSLSEFGFYIAMV